MFDAGLEPTCEFHLELAYEFQMEHGLSMAGDIRERMCGPLNPTPTAWRLSFVANVYSVPLYREIERRWGLGRPEYIVLFCLSQVPGLLARDIVALSGRPKNSISRAVAANVARGLVTAGEDKPGRAQPLVLTEAGQALVTEILPLFVVREAAMLSPLDPGEQATLAELLTKLSIRSDGWDEGA